MTDLFVIECIPSVVGNLYQSTYVDIGVIHTIDWKISV